MSWSRDPSLCYTPASLRSMARSLGPHKVGVLLEVCEVVGGGKEGATEVIPENRKREYLCFFLLIPENITHLNRKRE